MKEVNAGGGVRLARLLHARANESLEFLVGRNRIRPLVRPQAHAPQLRRPAATQRLTRCRSGSMPPFASRGPPLGEGRRGWAWITAPSIMHSLAGAGKILTLVLQ